jgi:hypothetical protein
MFCATTWTLIGIGLLGQAESIRNHAGRFARVAYSMAFVGSVL